MSEEKLINVNDDSAIHEELVYEIDSTIDDESYTWVTTKFNKKNTILGRILLALIPIYGIIYYIAYGSKNFLLALIIVLVGCILNFEYYVLAPRKRKKIVELFEKNGETKNNYKFYSSYVERTNVTGNSIFKYENLDAFRESDKYIAYWAEPNRIIVLNKNSISEDKCDFLRNIVPKNNLLAYDKKIKNKIILGSFLLTIIFLGLIAMIIKILF